MAEYLMQLDELYQKATAKLGPLDKGNYKEYWSKAQELAKKEGIKRPVLVIDVKFKPGAHDFLNETPYPVREEEWDIFIKDSKTMCEHMPDVYVVDGEKYAIPI